MYRGGAFQPGQCGETPPICRSLLWAPISLQRSTSLNIWKHLDLDWLFFSSIPRFLWFHLAFLLSSRTISLSFSVSQTVQHLCTFSTKVLKMLRSKKIFQSLCENHFRRFVLQAGLVQNVSRGQIGCEVAHTSLIELSASCGFLQNKHGASQPIHSGSQNISILHWKFQLIPSYSQRFQTDLVQHEDEVLSPPTWWFSLDGQSYQIRHRERCLLFTMIKLIRHKKWQVWQWFLVKWHQSDIVASHIVASSGITVI